MGQSPRPSQRTPRKGFICFRLDFETTKNMNQVLARNGKEARRWPCKEHVIFCLHSAAWGLAPFTASFQDGLPAPPDSPTDATPAPELPGQRSVAVEIQWQLRSRHRNQGKSIASVSVCLEWDSAQHWKQKRRCWFHC